MQFQNRRNRTKKEGQKFKRKPQYEPLKLPLDSLFAKMPHSIIPEEKRQKYVDSDASEYEWQYESSDEDVVSLICASYSYPLNVFATVWLV